MRCNREQQQESAFIQGKILQSLIIFALQDLLVSVSFLIIVAIVNAMGVRRARDGVLPDEPLGCFGRYIGSFPKNKPEKAAHRIKVKKLSHQGRRMAFFVELCYTKQRI